MAKIPAFSGCLALGSGAGPFARVRRNGRATPAPWAVERGFSVGMRRVRVLLRTVRSARVKGGHVNTTEIPRTDWPDFLDGFSDRHDGWLVRVEVLSPRTGAQIEFANQPLVGLSIASLEAACIELTVTDETGREVTREIDAPAHVWLMQTDEGADEALQIKCTDSEVLLTFRSTTPVQTDSDL
jgi:hypothetical protein